MKAAMFRPFGATGVDMRNLSGRWSLSCMGLLYRDDILCIPGLVQHTSSSTTGLLLIGLSCHWYVVHLDERLYHRPIFTDIFLVFICDEMDSWVHNVTLQFYKLG